MNSVTEEEREAQFEEMMYAIKVATGNKDWPPGMLPVYWDSLKDWSPESLTWTLNEAITRCKWWPSVGILKGIAQDYRPTCVKPRQLSSGTKINLREYRKICTPAERAEYDKLSPAMKKAIPDAK